MYLYELLVIYLAIGSPLAMLRLTRRYEGVLIHDAQVFCLEFVFWLPLSFLRKIRRRVGNQNTNAEGNSFPRTDPESVASLRQMLGSLSNGSENRELKGDLDRYLCLYDEVLRYELPAHEGFELFAIAGNRNDRTGSACLARRNVRHIIEHRDRARSELTRTLNLLRLKDTPSDQNTTEEIAGIPPSYAPDRDAFAGLPHGVR